MLATTVDIAMTKALADTVVADGDALLDEAALCNKLRTLEYAGFLFNPLSHRHASPSPGYWLGIQEY